MDVDALDFDHSDVESVEVVEPLRKRVSPSFEYDAIVDDMHQYLSDNRYSIKRVSTADSKLLVSTSGLKGRHLYILYEMLDDDLVKTYSWYYCKLLLHDQKGIMNVKMDTRTEMHNNMMLDGDDAAQNLQIK